MPGLTLPAGAMLPSAHERKQIFYTLQRWSSYTAWNRILSFYQAWADVAKASLREASARGPGNKTSVHESDYVLILKALADCDDGVRRLRSGDKRVFRRDVNGDFVYAYRPVDHWVTRLHYVETGDMGLHASTPLLDEFIEAVQQLEAARSECSPDIIEPLYSDEPARTNYGAWMKEWLPQMTFPSVLPEVPEPTEPVLIATGRSVPYSGIWEPVDVPVPGGLLAGFRKIVATAPMHMIGTMNYLHGGLSAPQADIETPTENIDIDVVWRLLWRDDRYEDGTVPAEEAGCVFLRPMAAKPVAAPGELAAGAAMG